MSFCPIILTKGKNIGKMCGVACTQCHHVIRTCALCGKLFCRDSSYYSHAKHCKAIPVKKIKPTVVKKQEETDELCTKVQSLDRNITEMRNMLAQALLKPLQPTTSVINITNNLYQNIVLSDVGGFKTLCDKMGAHEATSFLCKLAAKPQVMALFEKVYLDCDPANYPVANNNGKDFFYRDSDDNIIHDEGGHKIAQLGERLMKNTFIEAADPLLTRFIKQNEGDHDGDDDDYDRLRELQNGAYKAKVDKAFIKELYPKTYNPNHEFFTKSRDALGT